MKQENIFTDKSKAPSKVVKSKSLFDYAKLLFPVLLFPLLYFPYTLLWKSRFAAIAARVIRSSDLQFLNLMLTGNNTVLLFWGVVTAAVMLAAIVIAVLRIRPWYIIPLYLAVMFSLCGICSLALYTAILS